MNLKYIVSGIAVVLILMFADHYNTVVEERTIFKEASDSLAETVLIQSKDNADKSALNVERNTEMQLIAKKLEKAKYALQQLNLNPEQSACYGVALPNGYHDSVRHGSHKKREP